MRIQIENRVSKRTLKDGKKCTQYLHFFNKVAPVRPHNQPNNLPLITVRDAQMNGRKRSHFKLENTILSTKMTANNMKASNNQTYLRSSKSACQDTRKLV